MNASEMLRLIDSISRDRNVEKEALFTDLEQAMVSAARKHFNVPESDEFTAEVDRITGQIHIWRGEDEIPLETLGRIPAQTAKQVMIQRFREDERASIFNEFEDRVGELTTGMAQRYEGGALIVQIGRAEGFMPRSEQIPGEQHQPGERVRCLILDVRETGSQVKIVLSRAHPDFIRRLFEVEVPEVAERIIEVKAMAREPGHRTKIAVSSIDSKVDAVGACVGVRGSRIKNIVDELGGEKIDIVRWNESSQVLIQNSLKPAEVVETSLCFELGRATVVVNEDQLSLAIGKRGQNVRLAARLTNWDVDILTPAEFSKGLDTMEDTLSKVEGVGEEQIDRLAALGIVSVLDIDEVGPDYLVEQLEVEESVAQAMHLAAAERAKIVAEEQQREKAAAEAAKAAAASEVPETEADAQALQILGKGGAAPASAAAAAPASAAAPAEGGEGGSIVDMLEARQGDETPPPAEESGTAHDESEGEAEPTPSDEGQPGSEPEAEAEGESGVQQPAEDRQAQA